jgi:hypothetical protein
MSFIADSPWPEYYSCRCIDAPTLCWRVLGKSCLAIAAPYTVVSPSDYWIYANLLGLVL